MIICFCWKRPQDNFILKSHHTLIWEWSQPFYLVCRIKGAAAKYPSRKEYKFSRESITQIIHRCFRYDQLLPLKMQSSLVPHCFWGKSAFFCNNMVAMVTTETPGFRPKRWLTLDKNFLFPSTMSLNHGKDQIFF